MLLPTTIFYLIFSTERCIPTEWSGPHSVGMRHCCVDTIAPRRGDETCRRTAPLTLTRHQSLPKMAATLKTMTNIIPNSNFAYNIADDSFDHFARRLESDFPFLRVTKIAVDAETVLTSEHGGMRIFCIHHGTGDVFLPRGYRTQEGDGTPLPADQYRTDSMHPKFVEILRRIQGGLDSASPKARPAVDAVLRRWKGETYCGDITGELWRLLEQAQRPWTTDPDTENAMEELFHWYSGIGFSTKTTNSWERLMAGDQLVVTKEEPLRVRGNFQCFSLENVDRQQSHVSAVRRLRFLLDTAGGCSPGFDPFRRLPITWVPASTGDGINFFNNHVVNIPAENSPTHFHPQKPIGGGIAQFEFYLVLDPAVYNLSTAGLESAIILFPDLADLARYEKIPLQPGMIVSMPPGTGHRGLNVFASVMTVPGFKPGNELYIDSDIFERTGGTSPYNERHLGSKNYERLENYF